MTATARALTILSATLVFLAACPTPTLRGTACGSLTLFPEVPEDLKHRPWDWGPQAERVDAVYRGDPGDPRTEREVTIASRLRARFGVPHRHPLGSACGLRLPVGHLVRLRLVGARLLAREPETVHVVLSTPVTIAEDRVRYVRVQFDPERPSAWSEAGPVFDAKEVDRESLDPVVEDRIRVWFNQGVSRSAIDGLSRELGTHVRGEERWGAYAIELPAGLGPRDAVRLYNARTELVLVASTVPRGHSPGGSGWVCAIDHGCPLRRRERTGP